MDYSEFVAAVRPPPRVGTPHPPVQRNPPRLQIDTDQRVSDTIELNTTANEIASGMQSFGANTNNLGLQEAANTMLAACSSEAVPKPPTSFNYITDCVNTVMLTLNQTTFSN